MIESVKCQVCNNKTSNPTGLCHLHRDGQRSGQSVHSVPIQNLKPSLSTVDELAPQGSKPFERYKAENGIGKSGPRRGPRPDVVIPQQDPDEVESGIRANEAVRLERLDSIAREQGLPQEAIDYGAHYVDFDGKNPEQQMAQVAEDWNNGLAAVKVEDLVNNRNGSTPPYKVKYTSQMMMGDHGDGVATVHSVQKDEYGSYVFSSSEGEVEMEPNDEMIVSRDSIPEGYTFRKTTSQRLEKEIHDARQYLGRIAEGN